MSIYTGSFLNLSAVYEQLSHFAELETFFQQLTAIYGGGYDFRLAGELRAQWQKGDFSQLPPVVILTEGELGDAKGAYAPGRNVIYLSDRFLASASPQELNAVLREEIGHYVDAVINTKDAPGDEGEYFAQIVGGRTLGEGEIQGLRTENDWGFAQIGGESILVEKSVFTVAQVTNNSLDDLYPQLSGSSLVWQTWDGVDYEIYYYNGAAAIALTNNTTDDLNPQISGNSAVWQSADGIYLYNGSTATLLPNSAGGLNPQIEGNIVVWQALDGADFEIYRYNGTTTTKLTNNNSDDTAPQISGNKIVWDAPNDKIALYNGSSTQLLGLSGINFKAPQISGNNAAWEGDDGNDTEIFFYNGSVTSQLTNNDEDDTKVQISGNKIVWEGFDGNDTEIFFFNGTTVLQLTNNLLDDVNPQIFDNFVVWDGDDGNDTEIYLYDGATTVALSANTEDDETPQISGNYVVWSGRDAIGDYEIKLANLDPPSLSLTVSPASVNEDGAANLVFTFTRTGSLTNVLTINYSLAGTATNGVDYGAIGNSVTFLAGSNTATVIVNPTADTVFENTETVSLTLSGGSGYLIATPGAVTGSIVNDDTQVSLSVSPSTVNEDGAANLLYTFTRAGITANALTVNYLVSGTAANGLDYGAIGTSVSFAPGATTATVTVDPLADTLGEFNETVVLTLASGAGYSIGSASTATGTIVNDDSLFAQPFDLLLLQDLSGSFGDDITTVRTLIPGLVSGINSLQPNTPIGVSAFIDKPIAPFGGPSPTDYVYKTNQALTTNAATIQTVYNGLTIGSGADAPEAQLEALLQTALRPEEIGFRAGTKRVVVVFTDAAYHVAGDGAVSGITTPNNYDAILDGTPPGTGEDYPTLAGLKSRLIDANIFPLFAVTSDQITTYNSLVNQLGIGGAVVQLSANSSNIINAIQQGLNNLFLVNIDAPTSGLITTEGGASSSFTLKLNVQPIADVTLGLSVSDPSEGALSTTALVFTPSNWNIAQTVTVTGLDDGLADDSQTYQIITAPLVSADPNYNGVNPIDINVTNQESALPVITLTVSPDSSSEDGAGTVTYTFSRTGSSVNGLTVNYAIGGTAVNGVDYGAIGASITFAPGSASATLIIDPIADATPDGDKTVSLTLSANPLYLLGTPAAVTATILDDDTVLPTITGTTGNDTLNGTTGAEILVGLAGNDAYTVNNIGDQVVEALNGGTDTVKTSINYGLPDNVEKLTLTGTANLNGTGNDLNNTLTGNSGNNILIGLDGNDTLDGKAGTDDLQGGAGNDTYTVDNAGDLVTEGLNQGTDTVKTSLTFTLGANLENLTLTGAANLNGTGNALANKIIGNSGNNVLTGGASNDTLTGNGGSDSLVGGTGNDTLNLGLNDAVADVVFYASGDGVDTVNQFVKGLDKLSFSGMGYVDVLVAGSDVKLSLGNGILGDPGFGSGTLLATLKGVAAFTAPELTASLDSSNTAIFSLV